jgi:hypothetical protein
VIDKEASSYALGNIVVVRVAGQNVLGHVVATDPATARPTIGGRDEPDCQVAVRDVIGRGVLNTP